MEKLTLTSNPRSLCGKGASRRLRKEGLVPAIVYGNKFTPISLAFHENEVNKLLGLQGILSKVIHIEHEGQEYGCLLKSAQRHPYKNFFMHLDLFKIDENEMVLVHIPIEFINVSKCFGVKNQGGMITHNLNEVELKSKPGNLPEKIVVDMEDVKMGETIHLSDLKVPQGVIVVELLKGKEYDLAVAKVIHPDESSYDTPEAIETEATRVSDTPKDAKEPASKQKSKK